MTFKRWYPIKTKANLTIGGKWSSGRMIPTLMKYHRNFITNPRMDLACVKKVSCSVPVGIPVIIMWTLNSYPFWYSCCERWNNNSRQLQTPFTLFMYHRSSYTLISLWLLWRGMWTYCPSARCYCHRLLDSADDANFPHNDLAIFPVPIQQFPFWSGRSSCRPLISFWLLTPFENSYYLFNRNKGNKFMRQ